MDDCFFFFFFFFFFFLSLVYFSNWLEKKKLTTKLHDQWGGEGV